MVDLNTKERATLAFCLFTSAMRMGPDSFYTIEAIARKTGVQTEFANYAKDWNSYAATVNKAQEMGITPFMTPDREGPGTPDLFKP